MPNKVEVGEILKDINLIRFRGIASKSSDFVLYFQPIGEQRANFGARAPSSNSEPERTEVNQRI